MAARSSYAVMAALASELCEAGGPLAPGPVERRIEGEDDFARIAGGQFHSGAFIEIVEVERVGLEAAGARLQLRVLPAHRSEAAFERALARLQVDIGHEALMPRDRVRAQIKDGCSQPDAERSRTVLRHISDPS